MDETRAGAVDGHRAGVLADFPDWISPVLVKEFRQALRGRTFEWGFVALHLGMLLTVASGLVRQQRGADASFVGFIFWMLMITVLLVVLPMRGMMDLAEDRRTRNLELMASAGVTGARLALGKWIALMTQGLLLVVSLLPYFAMRYFAGGVDLVMDGKLLVVVFLLGAVLSAGGIAAGGLGGLARGGAALVIGFLTLVTTGFLTTLRFGPAGMAAFNRLGWTWLLIIAIAVASITVLLRLAGDALGSVSENGAAAPRVILIAGWGLILADVQRLAKVGAAGGRLGEMWMAIFVFWIGLTILVHFWFLGPQREVRSVHLRSMRGRGVLGRWIRVIFAPQWVGSALLPLIVLMCVLGALDLADLRKTVNELMTLGRVRGGDWLIAGDPRLEVFVILQFVTLFPAGLIVWRLFYRRVRDGRAAFFLMMVFGGLLASLLGSLVKVEPSHGVLFLAAVPPVAMWLGMMEGGNAVTGTVGWGVASIAVFLLYQVVAMWMAVRWWKGQSAWGRFLEAERERGGGR